MSTCLTNVQPPVVRQEGGQGFVSGAGVDGDDGGSNQPAHGCEGGVGVGSLSAMGSKPFRERLREVLTCGSGLIHKGAPHDCLVTSEQQQLQARAPGSKEGH